MDEVAYLDQLTLDVVDRPPGVSSTPDERFAPEGPRPTGETIAWSDGRSSRSGRPTTTAATSTDALRAWDRRTVDGFRRLRRLDRLRRGARDRSSTSATASPRFGPTDRLVLCLAGWVEYPYSQTNYAAATAGVALRPPVLERRRGRRDLGGDRPPPRLSRRAPPDDDRRPDRQARPAPAACSGSRPTWNATGTRRSSPSATPRGRRPDHVAAGGPGRPPRPGLHSARSRPTAGSPCSTSTTTSTPPRWPGWQGRLTRHGDVARCSCDDDDQLCMVGPGDEVRLEFDARGLPDLPDGLDPELRPPGRRLLQGCRPVHRRRATPSARSPGGGCPPIPFGPGVGSGRSTRPTRPTSASTRPGRPGPR